MTVVQQSVDNTKKSTATTSPCIGICSVTVGDTVCRGCFRTLDDIACWSQLDEHSLATRLTRRQLVMQQTFTEFFELKDQSALHAQWAKHIATPPQPQFAEEAWMHLLQKGAHRMHRTEAYGILVRPLYQGQSIKAVWRLWREQLMRTLEQAPIA